MRLSKLQDNNKEIKQLRLERLSKSEKISRKNLVIKFFYIS